MDTSNLEKWEANMTASERRILVSYLVGQCKSKMMSDEMDDLRIGCFERTRCLITRNIDVVERDKKIKPHGVTVSFKVPTEASPLDLNIQEEVGPHLLHVLLIVVWSNILNKIIMKLAMTLMMINYLKKNRILLEM